MDNKQFHNLSFPLTNAQKRIWYTEKLTNENSFNNICGSLIVKGNLDLTVLEHAINLFIQKNDALRLNILEENGEPYQYVRPYQKEQLEYHDFSSGQDSEENCQKWMKYKSHQVTKPEDYPLYYFGLFKISEEKKGYYFQIHHIIGDGWSTTQMTNQIWDYYSTLLNGEGVNPDVEFSFIDSIDAERKYLESARYIKDKKYWLDEFSFESAMDISFPSLVDETAGKRTTFLLNAEQSNNIRDYVKETNCSLNTFFMSVFMIYMYQTTMDKNIVIGNPVLNRTGRAERNIFGMFTSTMPFKINIEQGVTFEEFYKTVNLKLKKSFLHQKYPYNHLMQDLKLREKGYDNLFDVCVNYYNTKIINDLHGSPILSQEIYNGNQLYNLQLVIKDWENNKMQLDYDYKKSIYSYEKISRMHGHLLRIIENVLEKPSIPVDELDLVSNEQKDDLVNKFNLTHKPLPKGNSIIELIEDQALKTPNNIALEYNGKTLTYQKMNERANQLARLLTKKGVEKGSRVCLYANHSLEAVVAILAILKVGGIYVPIDPSTPRERIKYIIENSDCNFILTNILELDLSFRGTLIDITSNESLMEMNTNLGLSYSKEDVAYIIYTSGSTGNPKGVMIRNVGLINYVYWAMKTYITDINESFALYSSFSFDLTITSIFTPLINGNKTIIYREIEDEFILLRILQENKANVVKLTPAHLQLLVNMHVKSNQIKKFIVGGEALSAGLVSKVRDLFNNNVEIYNEYGPTETVVGSMVYKISTNENNMDIIPIGKPIDNTKVYVLNRDRKPLPIGEVGELYISGLGLAKGYINLPEETQYRFQPNPFVKNQLMYKTGDLARFIDEETITYMGRSDSQVKLRGYRIELSEIERKLNSHDLITSAVVEKYSNYQQESEYLQAFIVSSDNLKEDDIKNFLGKSLPEYMIPTSIMQLKDLPLTINGKIDKKKLEEFYLARKTTVKSIKESVTNLNNTHLEVFDSIKRILKRNDLEMSENFINAGGDSIKAIQIAAHLRNADIEVKVKDILASKSIYDIIQAAKKSALNIETPHVVKGIVEPTPAISWFFKKHFTNYNHWNQSITLKLNLDVDHHLLQQSLNMLFKHHDTLRLNYIPTEGKLYYNDSHLQNPVPLIVYDLSMYDQREQEQKIIEYGNEIKSSFDIESGILFKACLFNLGDAQGKRLVLTAHHLIIDGVSWRIIVEDLENLYYNHLVKEKSFSLGNKTDSFKQWAELLHSIGASFENEIPYWLNTLGCNFDYPVDFNKQEDLHKYNDSITFCLSIEKTRELLTTANETFTTSIQDLLVTALCRAIFDQTSKRDIVLEMESHGRQDLESNINVIRTIGWFTSLYPVLLNLGENNDISSQIKSIKEQLRAVPNNGIGYGFLTYVRNVLPETDRKLIRFNYLGQFESTERNLFQMESRYSGSDIGKDNVNTYLIEIIGFVLNGRLHLQLTFNSNRFKRDAVEKFMLIYSKEIDMVLEKCLLHEKREFTPSDFELTGISQADLDKLFS
ncbi:non-ribosomal peptide synthetase [Bacillus pseudomycoides]|uniref:non-ribosomal peptide synthetase n=1 Tax=Bacillus pseudomycoides TaxID=64104 RepID=UPI0015CF32B2|nr:non-ribosomal peptide synthetase [Bacillus pseudomycoides]